jgi:hypothetical protein
MICTARCGAASNLHAFFRHQANCHNIQWNMAMLLCCPPNCLITSRIDPDASNTHTAMHCIRYFCAQYWIKLLSDDSFSNFVSISAAKVKQLVSQK